MCAYELTVRVCVCTVEFEVDGCKKCMPTSVCIATVRVSFCVRLRFNKRELEGTSCRLHD